MGYRRRALGGPKVSIARTGIDINGCQLYVGGDAGKIGNVAEGFKRMFMERMNEASLRDVYRASFIIRERLLAGESLWN